MTTHLQRIIVEEIVKAKTAEEMRSYLNGVERGVAMATKAIENEFTPRPKVQVEVTKLGGEDNDHKIIVRRVVE